ncbi:MAG TPA: tRNA lysidine(34) synthetase TilS, partial [Flavisolibacter sp.]|nr:tRNA lysidine(34) synthetase TilS [Flavisolibacter sp.]
MDLLPEFKAYVKTHELFTREHRLLIAISGGIDSVVLTHLCSAAGYGMELAHCNFGLRGAESDRDEAFVKRIAEELQVRLWTKKFDTQQYAADNKCSVQVAARTLRYQWFALLMTESERSNGFDFLLTAHHLDDNVETVLMNFCKGTGVKGLAGIQKKRGKILRPLLFARREEINAYAAAANLAWVEDSSNEESKYTRNYFRHVVIPQVSKVYPEIVQNIQGNIDRFREIGELYQQAIRLHKKHLVEQRGAEVQISVLKLLRARPLKSIVYEIIKEYGFRESQVAGVLDLLHSESGKYIPSTTHRILRNR